MGCGHAPHGGAYPHKSIPLHFQTYLFSMVGTVVSLLALLIYYLLLLMIAKYKHPNSSSTLVRVGP